MPRYIAFLRAVNVGGRTIKMADLSAMFRDLAFEEVETFIASGNVIFRCATTSRTGLETKIEQALHERFGFAVDCFLRKDSELETIAAAEALPSDVLKAATALNVGFLKKPLSTAQKEQLAAFTSAIDTFATAGLQVYWACQKKQSESKFANALFEKRLGLRCTFRSLTTVRKLAERVRQ